MNRSYTRRPGFGLRRKNRKRLTLLQRGAIVGCLLLSISGFASLMTAGTRSAQAEVSSPCEIKPLSLPEKGDFAGGIKLAEAPSAAPMTRFEVKGERREKAQGAPVAVVRRPVEAVKPEVKAEAPAAVQAKPEPKAVAEARSEPSGQDKESVIPSFENTAGGGEPEKQVEVAGASTQETPAWKTIVSVMFKLALVIALAYASMLGLKWFMQNKQNPLEKGHSLKVVETVSLGANRSLHVVQCGGRQMILASTPNQVNLISESESQSAPLVQAAPTFEGVLQTSIAKQSEMDTAAMKVGTALRNGAAFLFKKASEYKASHGGGNNAKNA